MVVSIKDLAKFSATATYTASKISPFSSFITMCTIVALYTGWDWLLTALLVFTASCIAMLAAHMTGILSVEQVYWQQLSDVHSRFDKLDKRLEKMERGD